LTPFGLIAARVVEQSAAAQRASQPPRSQPSQPAQEKRK